MKTCIIIAGPTAVGKTAIAIQLAQHFSTEIISADSRQCYKELNIGVAKPSTEELKSVHHYFINSHSIQDHISAADFENYALSAIENIFEKNDVAVMVGGTGLYIKAFMQGLDPIPAINEDIRNSIIKNYESKGIAWLQQEIKKEDPVFFAEGEILNPQRIMRALEVKLVTGNSIISYQSENKKQRDFKIIAVCLQLPREELYGRINNRADEMITAGLLLEAGALLPYRRLNALQTVGYKEIFEYLNGNISLDKAIELIKQHTRQYAKRQVTWFKKEEGMHFCNPSLNEVLTVINNAEKKLTVN